MFFRQKYLDFDRNIKEFDIDGFLHANDLSYISKPDDEIVPIVAPVS